MRSCVTAIPNYEQEKKRIYTSIGFEDGTAVGTISFEQTNPRILAREFLGLGDGLAGSGVITPAWFGIPDNSNKLTFKGRIFIRPTAHGKKIEIRLRRQQGSRQLVIPGHSYAIAILAGGPWVRFSGGGIEIMASASGDNTIERAWSYDRRESLGDLETLGLFYSWLLTGKVDLQIWSGSARAFATTISANVDHQTAGQWNFFSKVVGQLVNFAGPSRSNDLKMSVDEIVKSRELLLFYHMITAPSVRIELDAEFPKGLDRGLYYVWVDVGEVTAYCVVQRKLYHSSQLDGGQMRLDFERPRILDRWLVEHADVQQRTTMREDYQKAVDRLNSRDIKVIVLGDIRNFWCSPAGGE
jgi:hypothetical protein